MAGTFPTTIKPSSISLQDNRPNLINQSVSGKRVIRKYGSQYFTIDVTLPPLIKADAMNVFGFLKQQQNSFEKFDFQYPITNRGLGKQETDIVVNGAKSLGDSDIELSGFSNSQNNCLRAGDVIKFNNHNKIYMVTEHANSDSSGNTTISISPSIISTLTDNEAVDVNSPFFKVYLESDVLYTTDASGLFSINFSLRECIE